MQPTLLSLSHQINSGPVESVSLTPEEYPFLLLKTVSTGDQLAQKWAVGTVWCSWEPGGGNDKPEREQLSVNAPEGPARRSMTITSVFFKCRLRQEFSMIVWN